MNIDTLPIVCINLRRRPDRWEKMQQEPGFLSFPQGIQRYDAIDGRELDISKDSNVSMAARRNITFGKRRGHHEVANKASIAIYHTHVGIWKYLLEKTDAPAIIILEDDLQLAPDAHDKLKALCSHPAIQSMDWDILNPGARVPHRVPIDDTLDIYTYSYLFHFYIVSRRGAERLIKYAYPIEMHVDHYAGNLAQLGLIKTIGPHTRMFYQNETPSDNRDGDCDLCDLPTDAKKLGGYAYGTRLKMHRLEESILLIGLLLGGLYMYKHMK